MEVKMFEAIVRVGNGEDQVIICRLFYSSPQWLYALVPLLGCMALSFLVALLLSSLSPAFFIMHTTLLPLVFSLSLIKLRRPDDENIDTKIMEAVKARLPPKVDGEEGNAAVATATAAGAAAAAAGESGSRG